MRTHCNNLAKISLILPGEKVATQHVPFERLLSLNRKHTTLPIVTVQQGINLLQPTPCIARRSQVLHQKLGLFFRETHTASPFHHHSRGEDERPSAFGGDWPKEIDPSHAEDYYERSTPKHPVSKAHSKPASSIPTHIPPHMSVAQVALVALDPMGLGCPMGLWSGIALCHEHGVVLDTGSWGLNEVQSVSRYMIRKCWMYSNKLPGFGKHGLRHKDC